MIFLSPFGEGNAVPLLFRHGIVGSNWNNGTKCRSRSVNWNNSIRFRSTLASYDGWAKWAQTYHLRQKLEINKLQEMIGMRGIPKHLNTKFDYEFIRSQNLTGWQKHWQDLLDGYMGWISTGVLADGETGVEDETHKVDTQEEKELDSDVVTTTRHQLEYKVNPNCKLLRIGFTLEEVEAGLT